MLQGGRTLFLYLESANLCFAASEEKLQSKDMSE